MKKGLIFVLGFGTATLLSAGIMYASTLVNDVYLSPFGIKLNGQVYNAEMPVLNYQGRTYLALRELGTVTGNEIDFVDNTIIINNNKSNDILKNNVENNGGTVVKCDGKTYYWKLNKNSRENTGIFESYGNVIDNKNELICRDENGNETVILKDVGYDNIYIANNKIYLSNNEIVYSVDLNGKNKKVYNDVTEIFDGNEKYIIAKKGEKVVAIYASNDRIVELFKNAEFGFKKINEDTVYYTSGVSYNSREPITIRKINIQTLKDELVKEILLSEYKYMEADYGEDTDDWAKIRNGQFYSPFSVFDFDIYDGYVYIIYGIEAGTGHFINLSKVSVCKLDGTDFRTIYSSNVEYDDMLGAYAMSFYKKDNVDYENKYLILYTTAEVASNTSKSSERVIINLNGFYKDRYVTDIIDNEDIISRNQKLNQLRNITYYNFSFDYKNFAILDDYAYYLIDFSSEYPEADIGWRTGYKLEKSYYMRQNIKTNATDILYEIKY